MSLQLKHYKYAQISRWNSYQLLETQTQAVITTTRDLIREHVEGNEDKQEDYYSS